MLVLVFILLSILMPTVSRSNNTVASYGYFEVVIGIVSAAIVLVNAFLVKPYFREVAKTGNGLDVNIREVTVKDIEG
jgi:Kef-type K+ transport system membrane component KefB